MPQQVPTVTIPDLPDSLPEGVTLLDVRELDEWAAGHAPEAVHIPMSELAGRLADLPAMPAMPAPTAASSAGGTGGLVAPVRLGQVAPSLGLSGSLGPVGVSANVGWSTGTVGYLDLNGDRFPDTVLPDLVVYTNPRGGVGGRDEADRSDATSPRPRTMNPGAVIEPGMMPSTPLPAGVAPFRWTITSRPSG